MPDWIHAKPKYARARPCHAHPRTTQAAHIRENQKCPLKAASRPTSTRFQEPAYWLRRQARARNPDLPVARSARRRHKIFPAFPHKREDKVDETPSPVRWRTPRTHSKDRPQEPPPRHAQWNATPPVAKFFFHLSEGKTVWASKNHVNSGGISRDYLKL